MSLTLILVLFASYMMGSFPTSILIGKLLRRIDIREQGSGNADGFNVLRVLGWKPALVLVVFDIFKGWLPDLGVFQVLCGFCAVLGHTYPVFAEFKGGKGVATLAGMMIALFPQAVPICMGIFTVTVILTGYTSVGSIIASAFLPVILLIFPLFGFEPAELSLLIFSLLVPFFMIFTHRSNISRLRMGEENRFEKAMIFNKRA